MNGPKEEQCETSLLADGLAGEARIWLEKVDEFNPFEHLWISEDVEAEKMDEAANAGTILPLNYEAYFWMDRQRNSDTFGGAMSAALDMLMDKHEREDGNGDSH